ncbi:MAG: DUF1302 domain-containing protein [Deltaproteobacteria bacterium]|nr:DUF1302 domain-containing protein [Deltaproteobacteria bacterium]
MGKIRISKRPWLFGLVFFLWFALAQAWPGLAVSAGADNQLITEDDPKGFEDGFEDNDPFEEIDIDALTKENVQNQDGKFLVGGFIEIESEYAFHKNDEKLSGLKPLLFIETEYKINENYKVKASGQAFYDMSYDIEAKDNNKGSNLDDEKKAFGLKDFYLDGKMGDIFSVRIGRQIIAWGDSDYARITDVVNPRDLTSPGLTDLEDARLPVAAFRLSAFFNAWSFDFVTVHEHPGSKISGKGSDFDYYTLLRSPVILINDKHTPDSGIKNTSFAFKATHAFNGGDISFVAADTFDDKPFLSYDGPANGIMVFTPEYGRIITYGVSASLAKGSGLFKFETAFTRDKKIMRNDVLANISSGLDNSLIKTTSSKNQVSSLAGVEYTGFTDLRLSFEAQLIHTLNHRAFLSVDENEYLTYFKATKDLLNETLELALFWVFMNPGQGNILRLSGTLDIFDALSVGAGMVFYDAADLSSDLHPYKDRDRVFIRVKYSF